MAAYTDQYDIVRQTARKDLTELVNIGLIIEDKDGRNIIFRLNDIDKIESYMNS